MQLNELLKVFWGNKIELYSGTSLVACGCTRSADIRGFGNHIVKSAFVKENQNEVVFAVSLEEE